MNFRSATVMSSPANAARSRSAVRGSLTNSSYRIRRTGTPRRRRRAKAALWAFQSRAERAGE
jgi:hypothetical protein